MSTTISWKYWNTARIIECLDFTEYLSLSSNNKDLLKAIISAGTFDARPGSEIRELLTDVIFPSGTTHDNLVILFTAPPEGPPEE